LFDLIIEDEQRHQALLESMVRHLQDGSEAPAMPSLLSSGRLGTVVWRRARGRTPRSDSQ
jgi:hypothetical protein